MLSMETIILSLFCGRVFELVMIMNFEGENPGQQEEDLFLAGKRGVLVFVPLLQFKMAYI